MGIDISAFEEEMGLVKQSEKRTLRTSKNLSTKKVGGFFTSVPGEGVRKAFGEKAPKKKKGKKKAKTKGFRGRGPLAESPRNILVDRPVRNPFVR